jgi:diguanylate cyclase (GGDEF)-like protein
MAASFAVIVIGFVWWMLATPGGQTVADNLDDFSLGVVAVVASVWCVRRSLRSTGREAIAWRFLGASALCWGIGEFVYSVLALHETVPSPSAADVGYLAAAPLGLVGIIYLARPESGRNWTVRALIDGFIVAGSLLIVSWTTALGTAYESSSTSHLGRIVNLAYPISDIVLATVALNLLSSGRRERRTTLLLVIAGELCFAFGDSAFAYVTARNNFTYPNVIDVAWIAAFAFIALAAQWARPERSDAEPMVSGFSRVLVAIPYAAVTAALVAEVVSGMRADHLHSFLVIMGVLVLLATIGRQIVVTVQNGELTTKLEELVARLQEREERLLHYALHDPLTGLANRLALDDRIEEVLAEDRGRVEPIAVLLCDLDGFKRINDTMGHSIGDFVLRAVAHRLRESVRPGDVIVRTGGDEFAVLVNERSGFSGIEQIAATIVERVRTPIAVDTQEIVVRVSVGIALGQHGEFTAETLLRDADVALYGAKSAGGNTVRVFDESTSRLFFERLDLQSDLIAGIGEGELTAAYQPIVDLRSGAIAGVESLLRWNHPRRGILRPAAFLSMAEESGLIVPIGRQMMTTSLTQIAAWRRELPEAEHLWVSVNVSARQLLADDLTDLVRDSLMRADAPADALHVELTESALMDQSRASLAIFETAKALGVTLVIDDFGTGYSSLSYLHRMPIHALKIDQSFIADLDQNDHATKIIEAVIALAHALDLEVVAEGVQTREQLVRLTALGCEFAQGHLFCEPLPPEQFAAWWNTTHRRIGVPIHE